MRRFPGDSRSAWSARFAALVVVAVVTVGFAVGDALAQPETQAATTTGDGRNGSLAYDWKWDLAPGKTLEIEGVNGAVRATAAANASVAVTARKRAKHSDPDQVSIEVIQHEGGVTLCVKYPDTHGSHNTCAPGGHSHMRTDHNDVAVDFDVKLPAGVKLSVQQVNGDVELKGLASDVAVKTVNGGIKVETRGSAEAETVNGSIDAAMTLPGSGGPYRFETVNGSIALELPEDAGAEVKASTVNGGIETDFPVTVQGKFGTRSLQGTLGKGGPTLKLQTVNGSIKLRKASSI